MNLVLIIGNMGAGKTSLAAEYLATKIQQESKEYRLVCLPVKDETTIPIYEKALGTEVKRWKGFTYLMASQYGHDKLLWFEDYPLLTREKQRAGAVESTITALGRQNRLFCVIVSQVSLPKEVPWDMKVELKKDGNRHLYKVRDRMATTGWKEHTNEEKKLAEILLNIEHNGIVGSAYQEQKKFDTGRPIDGSSYQAKIYSMFASGKKPREITKELGVKSQSYEYVKVYTYYSRWKSRGKAGLGAIV